MKLTHQSPGRLSKADLLVAFAVSDGKPALPSAGIDLPAGFAREVRGEAQATVSTFANKGPVGQVLVVGLGKSQAVDAEAWRRSAALGIRRAEAAGAQRVTYWVEGELAALGEGAHATGRAVAEGVRMGAYQFLAGKSERKNPKVASVALVGEGADFKKGVARGGVLAAANCFTRDLQNPPGNQMTPRALAASATKLARKSERITCRVLEPAQMKRLGMGLLLGVAQGSVEPPRLIHLTYKPKGRPKGKIALVGKGLTFDAGGISLKPPAKMDEMRFDMSGGAAVLGVFHALGSLDVPWEVHGVVPATENLIDGGATKPGDIHRSMNGKTVEVLNTDAEGRLILADALAYVEEKVRPDTIIDLATLTGAVVVGLGHEVSGMFASTEKLRDELSAAGEATGELVWPLPLFEFHRNAMKGTVADLKNISSPDVGGGSITGAAFLSHFVGGDTEWCHLDIAGTAWGGSQREWVGGQQGSGFGTRLLVEYLERRG